MDMSWLTIDSLRHLEGRPLAGRMFRFRDPKNSVAVVEEEAARQLFGMETVGTVLQDATGHLVEIIGVVKKSADAAKEEPRPTIYYDYTDHAVAPESVRNAHFRAPVSPPKKDVELNFNIVSAAYFGAFGFRVLAGQLFDDTPAVDGRSGAVVNQEAADLYFNGNALGAALIDEQGVRREIIGVVQTQPFGAFQQHTEPTLFVPMQQDSPPRLTLILSGPAWDKPLRTVLRRRLALIPGYQTTPVLIKTLTEQLEQSAFAPLRIATLMCNTSTLIALLLSVLGLFNSQQDTERQRQRELAIRVALGSQRWRIAWAAFAHTGRLSVVGTGMGILSFLVFLRSLLHEDASLGSPSLWIWMMASAVPFVTVAIASLFPVIRASLADPLSIMRDET
jgi:hypothetical protein